MPVESFGPREPMKGYHTMENVTAHAEVAEAVAVAAPDDEPLARLIERVDKLTLKVEKQRLQLEETEIALAEAIAEVEGI